MCFKAKVRKPPPGLPRLLSSLSQQDDFDGGGDFLKKGVRGAIRSPYPFENPNPTHYR